MGFKSRLFVAAGFVVGGIGLMAPAASAGEPVVHACHGETNAALTPTQPPDFFGHAVVGFAQAPDARPGVGDGIELLHAGLVPDEVVPNTCND